MAGELPEEWFIRDERVNAAIAWLLAVGLVLVAVVNLLSVRLVPVILAGAAAAMAIVPAVVSRSWTRTVPWPLLLLASVPIVVGPFGSSFVQLVATGTGIAALGMLLIAVLQLSTSLRMTPRFALGSVFLMTLAVAGFWAVGSAASATYLGTWFVTTNDELMAVFTASLLGGLLGGLVFRWYFRRQLRREVTTVTTEVEAP
jgi:hypothetical protein